MYIHNLQIIPYICVETFSIKTPSEDETTVHDNATRSSWLKKEPQNESSQFSDQPK